MYFTEETEQKILEYQKTRDERLFEKYIYIPFEKIASSLLHKLKTYDIDGDLDVIIQETIVKMWRGIDKFNPSKGTNAFSYFSVIARYYLIEQNKKSQDILNKNIYIDEYNNNNDSNDSDLDEVESYTGSKNTNTIDIDKESIYLSESEQDRKIKEFNKLKEKVKEYYLQQRCNEKKFIAQNIYKLMENCHKFRTDVLLSSKDLIREVSDTTTEILLEVITEIKILSTEEKE